MIKLTVTNGTEIWINPNHIVSAKRIESTPAQDQGTAYATAGQNAYTELRLATHSGKLDNTGKLDIFPEKLKVNETPDEIQSLISSSP